jgi:hypothetical protein
MMTASLTTFVVSVPCSSFRVPQFHNGGTARIAFLSNAVPIGHTVDLHPAVDIEAYTHGMSLGDPIHVILSPRDGVNSWIAGAQPGLPCICLFPVVFADRGGEARRSLSEIIIMAGTPVGDLCNGLPQTLTQELSHCYLKTEDRVYNWDNYALLAAEHPPGVNPLDNADTIAALVFFLWCLFQAPEWDFSTGKAVHRRIPG